MGVAELKRLFKEIAKGVFTTTLLPQLGDYAIVDIMTTLHSMSNEPMTLEGISTMLFLKLSDLVTHVPRTIIVIADKESLKPRQKAQEQKRRDNVSETEPYPEDSEITANGIVIKGVLHSKFSVSRVMRSRGQRKFLLREITRLFMRDPKVCLQRDFVGTFILDMVDGERPVSITSPGFPDTHTSWLQSVGDFGEGDIGMLLYLRAIKRAVPDSSFSLVTADSDVLPIFFEEFQRDPTLKGNWIGYRQEWCNMRVLVDKLVSKGWNAYSCFLVACIGGCDFIPKSELVHEINFKFMASTIHKMLKTGAKDPLKSFDAFDELLMSVYKSWIRAQLKGTIEASALRANRDWDWIKEALTHLPKASRAGRLKPPVDPDVRVRAYETAKWLREYWRAK